MKTSLSLSALLFALCISACATTSGGEPGAPKPDPLAAKVANQATFDMQCERAELQVVKISDDVAFMGAKSGTYGVRGCGRQATYKVSCSMGQCSVFNEAQTRALAPR